MGRGHYSPPTMFRFTPQPMQTLFLFVATVALVACSASSPTGERVPLMQGKAFECTPKERVVHPAPKVQVDAYGVALNDYGSFQMPLYRMIESEKGQIYVSVVMADSTVDPMSVIQADTAASVVSVDRSNQGPAVLLRKAGAWYSIAFPSVLTDPRIAITFASADSATAHSWFTNRYSFSRVVSE